jgi:hypothetical protein
MYQKHLHLLGLLLEATQSGKAVWRRESASVHHSELSGYPCRLHFRRIPLADLDAPGGGAVDVSVGPESLRFYSGSEGYDVAEQILVAAYPEVLAQAQIAAVRLDAMMDRIENAAV